MPPATHTQTRIHTRIRRTRHAACALAVLAAAHAAHAADGIAWKNASSNADVDAAFAQAKAESKPVFVYWGAKWCPPCNQVKATLFNRADFIERSKGFVPVYVDGDSPGAQKLGARFRVSGYPTMLLFSAQGTELTRLPGEVDPKAYTEVLTLGMNAKRPVKELLAQVRAGGAGGMRGTGGIGGTGGAGLTPADWRLLAFYSWEGDEQQVVPKADVPAVLAQLAAACPSAPADVATRLRLKAWVAAGDKAPARPDAAAAPAVLKLLADPAAARTQMDVLANSPVDLVHAVSAKGTLLRQRVLQAFDGTLKGFEADTTLSRADRLSALGARIDLARIDAPKQAAPKLPPALPPELRADLREQTARIDRETTDGYERQAVIPGAAYLLASGGLMNESDAMLKAGLAKSHSPYYLMSALASNAKQRGDKAEALRWSEQAFDKSEGPATRLQWGAAHVKALVEMAPADEARIERAASQLFTEAAKAPDAFYERSGRSLQRVGKQLQAWNKGGAHKATLARLQAQLDTVCAALDPTEPNRARCDALLKTPARL